MLLRCFFDIIMEIFISFNILKYLKFEKQIGKVFKSVS